MSKLKSLLILSVASYLSACSDEKMQKTLRFSTSAEYPPFEYVFKNKLQGFDIDLANHIAQKLGKQAVFDNMQFSTVLPALNTEQDDLAISTITATPKRAQNFDFSKTYYANGMAMIYQQDNPILNESQLPNKKIAVQMGTTMEFWLQEHHPELSIVAYDNNNQAIEALEAKHVDGVLVDGVQGKAFSKKHRALSYSMIAKADYGYAIALKKNSPLTNEVNQALQKLQEEGVIQQLEAKWFKD